MGEDYPAPTAATTTVPKISGGMDDNFVEARLGAVTRVGLTSRDWLCRAAVETKRGRMGDSKERHLLTKRTGTAHSRHSDFSSIRWCFGATTQFEAGRNRNGIRSLRRRDGRIHGHAHLHMVGLNGNG